MRPSGISSFSSVGYSSSSILPSSLLIFTIIFSLVVNTLMAASIVEISDNPDTNINVTDTPITFPETNTRSLADVSPEKQREFTGTSEAEDMLNSKINRKEASVDRDELGSNVTNSSFDNANNETVETTVATNPKANSITTTTMMAAMTTITSTTVATTTMMTTMTTMTTTTTTEKPTEIDPTTTTTTTTPKTTTTKIPETTTVATTTIATTQMQITADPPVTEKPSTEESLAQTPLTEEESGKMPSGIIVLVTMISFAVVAVIGYISLIVWRRYLEFRYGNRELLVNDLEFDTNDLRHFEL